MALKKTKTELEKEEFEPGVVAVSKISDQKKLGTKKVEKLSETKPGKEINVAVKKEDIRGRIATLFLIGFFIVLISVVVVAGISDGNKIGNLKELLITVSGILAAPLGFVIGYYFRSQEEK